jgi:hypothetical protein
MPAKPRWYPDIAKIRRDLLALDPPFVDRAAVEKLFRVRPRQANNLMRVLGGVRTGTAMWVARSELIARLDELAQPRGVAGAATQRKASVLEHLNALHANARPRRIPPPPPRAANASLPAGASIASPGEMTVRFSSAEDLLGIVLGLSQSAVKDFAGFARSLEFPAPLQDAPVHIGNPAPAPDPAVAPAEAS